MVGKLPEKLQTADKLFDKDSLWWQMKLLSLLVAVNEQAFAGEIKEKLKEIEVRFTQKAESAEQQAIQLIIEGNQQEAREVLSSVTNECTEILYGFANTESKRLADILQDKGGLYGRQKEVIEKYIAYAQIPMLKS
jgi:dipeptidase